MNSVPARGHGRCDPSRCRLAVTGGGVTWTEGAVILGRRGAPACSGGGRSGADGERNNAQGPPGVPRNRRIKNERSRSGVDYGQWLGRPRQARRARERGATLLGLVRECPPAVEDTGNLAGSSLKTSER